MQSAVVEGRKALSSLSIIAGVLSAQSSELNRGKMYAGMCYRLNSDVWTMSQTQVSHGLAVGHAAVVQPTTDDGD